MSLTLRTKLTLAARGVVLLFSALLITSVHAVGIPPGTTLTSSGPITISGQSNVVISGKRISNPNGSCIKIKSGSSNVIIENSEIGPCGDIGVEIRAANNVTVRNNYIHDTGHEGVWSYESDHIAVDSNVIIDVRSGYDMWTTNKGHLSFTNNFVRNVHKYSSGVSGPGDGGGGNVVGANYVSGGGIRITDNIAINIAGQSSAEDLVNMFKSNGSAADPIVISRNKFYGGGPSTSSGGIILGDENGSYQVAEDNILVNPGQYGIAIAGGHNNTLRNNRVYGDDQRSFSNVGLYLWRFSGTAPGQCYGHTAEFNEVTFWRGPNYQGNGQPAVRMATWYEEYTAGADGLYPNCDSVAGWNNNKFDTNSAQPANLDLSLWNPAWNTPEGMVIPAPSKSTPPGNTCEDSCGGQSPDGCWCDDSCVNYGDCCSDRVQVCDGGFPSGPTCEGSCGGQSPDGCWCDDSCASYGDCCADRVQVCGG